MSKSASQKKTVPELRFPDFYDEYLSSTLKSHAKIYDGTHQTPKYTKTGIPFYSVEHVTANQFEKTKFVAEDVYEQESKRVKIERGDILMTRIGDIGTTRYIDWDVKASFYVSLALIKQSENYDSRYLAQYISSPVMQRELWKRTIHVAFPRKINLGEIGECEIKLPSADEQEKVAEFLTDIDLIIAYYQLQKKKLEQFKRGIMQKIFSQEVRFKDEDGSDFPEWQTVKLGAIFNERTERAGNKDYDLLSVTLKNGVTKYDESLKKNNSSQNKTNYKIVRKGDIAYNTMRMWQGASGVSSFEGIVSPAYTVVTPKNGDSNFFGYFFKWPRTVFDFYRYSQGLTSDTWNLKFKHFKEITVTVPSSVEEQQKITNFIQSIDKLIDFKSHQIEQAETWKRGLLQKMFV